MRNLELVKEEEIKEGEETKDISQISEKELQKAENEYSYLESNEKLIYSKNLSDEEAKLIEKIISRKAYSYFICNSFCKQIETVQDLRSIIVEKLFIKATVPNKKDGQVRIARNFGELVSWIDNIAKDHYRFAKRKTSYEDRYFDIDRQSADNHVESGDNRLYQESEAGRDAMRTNSISSIEFDQLFNSLLDESNYDELRIKYNLKPRHIEEIKKYIAVKAYHTGINDVKVIDLYKKYESELDEEKREMVAECVANKSNNGLTADVMLKTFFGIGSGINAGSAGRITQNIPVIVKEMISSKLPGYLN